MKLPKTFLSSTKPFFESFWEVSSSQECTHSFLPSELGRKRKECNYHVPYFALIRRVGKKVDGEKKMLTHFLVSTGQGSINCAYSETKLLWIIKIPLFLFICFARLIYSGTRKACVIRGLYVSVLWPAQTAFSCDIVKDKTTRLHVSFPFNLRIFYASTAKGSHWLPVACSSFLVITFNYFVRISWLNKR